MKPASALFILGLHFFLLSLIAFGGANGIVPEMHRILVHEYKWMTEQEFIDYFAISRGAPGPNILISTLVGWHVANFWGALATTLAICTPSCILAYMVGHLWHRFAHAPWLVIIKTGLVPVIVGFVAATALILVQVADDSLSAFLISGVTAILAYKNRIHPLWILSGAMILGILGWV